MQIIFTLMIGVVLSFNAHAVPVKEAKALSWVQAVDGKVTVRTESYEQLKEKCDLTFKAVSPHPMLNPTKKASEWKGLGFKGIVEKFGRKLTGDEEITLAAADGYAAQLNVRDLTEYEGMIAVFEDGKLIEPRRGGPQSMFPTLDPKLPPDMHCDCWGVWYMTAVILGDLPPILEVQNRKVTKSVRLIENPGTLHKSTPFRTPPGHFKYIRVGKAHFIQKNAKVSYESLDKILKTRFQMESKPMVAETYYGKEIPVDNPAEWNMEYLWQGKPISAKIGGPFHLCHNKRQSDCIFFLKSLKTKG